MQSCSSTTHGGPTTIADIKSYKPQSSSIGSGQVLQEPYPYEKAKLVVTEMADALALDLVVKGLVTNQIVITVGYDCDNENYDGEYSVDRYGRKIPKHAHGTYNLDGYSSSGKYLRYATTEFFDRIVDKKLFIRRLYIAATKVVDRENAPQSGAEQLDFFKAKHNKQIKETKKRKYTIFFNFSCFLAKGS